jgi:hypothetical protein
MNESGAVDDGSVSSASKIWPSGCMGSSIIHPCRLPNQATLNTRAGMSMSLRVTRQPLPSPNACPRSVFVSIAGKSCTIYPMRASASPRAAGSPTRFLPNAPAASGAGFEGAQPPSTQSVPTHRKRRGGCILYGSGLRILELMRLRIQDLNFEH